MKASCDYCRVSCINGIPCHESGCNGHFVFTHRNKKYVQYQVWSLDVLGNAKDGFEVNDRSKLCVITVPDCSSDKDVIKELKKQNLLNKRCHTRTFYLSGDELTLYLEVRKTSDPLYQLEVL